MGKHSSRERAGLGGWSFSFPHLGKEIHRKRVSPLFHVYSASVCKFPCHCGCVDFLKSPQPMAGCLFCFALFPYCQFDASKHYVEQVKCVVGALAELLFPVGCAHPSPFKARTALCLWTSYIWGCFIISNMPQNLVFMCRGC